MMAVQISSDTTWSASRVPTPHDGLLSTELQSPRANSTARSVTATHVFCRKS